jgi:hypothetical protein
MSKYLIIPEGDEKPFQKLLLTWHTGIDAIDAKDCFILNEEAFKLLDNYPTKTVSIGEVQVIAKDALKIYPLKDEKDIIFTTEQIEE